MRHEESSLTLATPSQAAGDQLYFQSWSPESPAKATIILVHGYDEHSGRYGYFAQHCVERGYAVHALDHWGHGKSAGDRGFVPHFSVYHDGLNALIAQLPAEGQQRPMILVGHSLGGLIAATYLLAQQSQFAAAILSGPAIKATDEPSAVLKTVSKLLSSIAPKLGVLGLDANGVSRDPKVVADYLADPLVSGTKISARLAAEMMQNMDLIQRDAAKITLPMLLMHGEEDSLTAPQGSVFLEKNIGSEKKLLKLYPELYHEIFNEPERDRVLTDMTDWIDNIAVK
ncbi:MAG: lysophospholipase [Parasphingorhabdus sp.]|uniref:alpha/beta hydrolase n=1 Tax=Parasphingorhabdus sp. TaxID=2709688 RepID=UPI003297FD4C